MPKIMFHWILGVENQSDHTVTRFPRCDVGNLVVLNDAFPNFSYIKDRDFCNIETFLHC